eukprot:Polyplicarium_translucidae@DN1512_c0_g1_i1.p1
MRWNMVHAHILSLNYLRQRCPSVDQVQCTVSVIHHMRHALLRRLFQSQKPGGGTPTSTGTPAPPAGGIPPSPVSSTSQHVDQTPDETRLRQDSLMDDDVRQLTETTTELRPIMPDGVGDVIDLPPLDAEAAAKKGKAKPAAKSGA